MAANIFLTTVILILILSIQTVITISVTTESSSSCYESIISFGDSLTDTGNLFSLSRSDNPPPFLLPPYGNTFFRRPTGRISDGRLVIDFIAEAMKLPLVLPYFDENGEKRTEFGKGVNYAVGGATVLHSFPWSVSPLKTQMDQFKQMLSSLCNKSSDCKEFVGRSLFLMGEMGGADHFYIMLAGESINVLHSVFSPMIVGNISLAIQELIELGAKMMIVPGIPPMGCFAIHLTAFQNSNEKEYDNFGCLRSINKLAEHHNQLLQDELNLIKKIHYHRVNIIYADYYNAFAAIFRSPQNFEFKPTLAACCGGGGPYNFNGTLLCGQNLSTSCSNPSTYINWDGGHCTEATYRLVAEGILRGPDSNPPVNTLCHRSDNDIPLHQS